MSSRRTRSLLPDCHQVRLVQLRICFQKLCFRFTVSHSRWPHRWDCQEPRLCIGALQSQSPLRSLGPNTASSSVVASLVRIGCLAGRSGQNPHRWATKRMKGKKQVLAKKKRTKSARAKHYRVLGAAYALSWVRPRSSLPCLTNWHIIWRLVSHRASYDPINLRPARRRTVQTQTTATAQPRPQPRLRPSTQTRSSNL
jgi:hypothetical protein